MVAADTGEFTVLVLLELAPDVDSTDHSILINRTQDLVRISSVVLGSNHCPCQGDSTIQTINWVFRLCYLVNPDTFSYV